MRPALDRVSGVAEAALPADYQRVLVAVRQAGGPVAPRAVGEALGQDTEVRDKLEPLRGTLAKLADRDSMHQRGEGEYTLRP
ncbi:hypothetical protein RI138_00235 [Streptomyces sp. C11-1]|uniref:Uncharacterized protein n=1 Tax=Streptomyces durocortorensis TaxID=2811104 RepID=A0ABY9VQE0_9ACTN|nr:hypothetical protein [Streptomyces durocortorensis]WNF25349.1 hypothetical protein RI138_00235 [Streptomyces durocortorensis]